MNVKSNISIPSNIYLRKGVVQKDIDYVQKVTGYSALKILNDKVFGTLSNAWLSDIQLQELREGSSCTFAKNNEVTHGKVVVNGKVSWVCRCEYQQCEKFDACSDRKDSWQLLRENNAATTEYAATPIADEELVTDEIIYSKPIVPVVSVSEMPVPVDTGKLLWENPAIVLSNIVDENNIVVCEPIDLISSLAKNFCRDSIKLAEPQAIIQSAPTSKIWVNAGPGTGKTYTVISRIIHLLENKLVQPEHILVLCYSRAAVAVIKNRIAEGVVQGILPAESDALSIYTFDSFASRYLASTGEKFGHLDYNERIELFNKQIKEQYFDRFKYLIIDELQDLVNERAMMVLNIVQKINCGFLLLGDICQAIYDFDCNTNNSLKSNEFYQALYNLLGGDTLKYELTTNNRQDKPLAQFTNEIRQVLLNSDNIRLQNEQTKVAIDTLEVLPEFAENFIPIVEAGKKTAILCRNNGEAEEISTRLHQKNIPHSLLRGANHKQKLNRWLADMFWDYTASFISQEDFVERYTIRTSGTAIIARTIFDYLCELTQETNERITLDKLMNALNNLVELDDLLAAEVADDLVVSTIHRAKGREFDHVYLLYTENSPARQTTLDEAKIQYVAVTRPKEQIKVIKKKNSNAWHFRTEKNSGRSFKINYKVNKYFYCSGIAVGHDDDIDPTSFVSQIFFEDVYGNQQYIAENIKKNDQIEIKHDHKQERYLMYHQNVLFGALSPAMNQNFWNVINLTWNKNNKPSRLSAVHVSDIISIVGTEVDESIPVVFRKSKVWLGLEICGLAKVDFT